MPWNNDLITRSLLSNLAENMKIEFNRRIEDRGHMMNDDVTNFADRMRYQFMEDERARHFSAARQSAIDAQVALNPLMEKSPVAPYLRAMELGSIGKTDLHHIPTEKLKALAERYQRRALVSPNDQGLHLRIQFIMNEIGLRQIVTDIEKDLAGL